jgi:metallophosphoesterase (TIGR00282 family)
MRAGCFEQFPAIPAKPLIESLPVGWDMPVKSLRILFVGDVFGRPGREAVRDHLPQILEERRIDLCVVNVENSAAGNGITPPLAHQFLDMGIQVLTSGNHVWDRKEILDFLNQEPRLLRPANYPPTTPGKGLFVGETLQRVPFAVINLQGRLFMPLTDCPFRVGEQLLDSLAPEIKVILVDFHAEATAEKQALGWFLDGKVSAVLGTHTHVATADERMLPKGTAYMTDVGMTGAHDSIIGVETDIIQAKFVNQMPARFGPAKRNVRISAVTVDIDPETGRAQGIERLSVKAESS